MLYNLARAEGRYKVACLWTVVVHLFAELLIEIANERYPNLSSTRRIDRAVVKDADKEID